MSTSIRVHPELSPRIIEVIIPATDITVQELYNLIRQWEDEPAHLSYPKLISAAGKEALGGGVVVGITATLQNARIMFTGRTTPLESAGNVTSGDVKGKTLYAIGGQFVVNSVYEGCTVFNSSTGGMAAVTEIISDIELKSFQLSGGSRDTWGIGDVYSIYPNVQCAITGGNLVAIDDVGNSISSVMQSPNVQVVRSSSSSATLQELGAIQYASFDDCVTINTISGYSGITFPIGTKQSPVNNLTDALLIAETRGFTTLCLNSDLNIDAGYDLNDFIIKGQSYIHTDIIISAIADVSRVKIINCNISGTLDGDTELHNCSIIDINYVNGVIQNCALNGTITLGGGKDAYIANCVIKDINVIPTIDMGGLGQDLVMPEFVGLINIKNLTGGNKVGIGLQGGRVFLDTATVTSGLIHASGIGVLADEMGNEIFSGTWNGGIEIINELINQSTIADGVWDEKLSDHLNIDSTGEKLNDIGSCDLSGIQDDLNDITDILTKPKIKFEP